MDAGIKGVGRLLVLLVDISLTHDAAETDLNMLARAAESIVQFQVTERGIEVVLPHQADRAFAEPDAFSPGGGAGHGAASLPYFVGASRGVLRGLPLAGLGRLLLTILGEKGDGYKGCRAEDCKETPNYTKHGSHDRFSIEADWDNDATEALGSARRITVPELSFVNGRSCGFCPAV
jgi:hypothetical protein